MTTTPETAALESMLRSALTAYERSDKENAALRRRVRDLQDELARRDADDALRGARCACTGYRTRFMVALSLATGLFVVALTEAVALAGRWIK